MSQPGQHATSWWRRLLGAHDDGVAGRDDGAFERERSDAKTESNTIADEEQLADIGYQPQVNQVRQEPMPASAHDDQRQEAVVRNEQLGVQGRDQDTSPLYKTDDQHNDSG
ncbi:MAG: hypothetical protein ACTHJW_22260 [Streptosporangiaceae bacterium]